MAIRQWSTNTYTNIIRLHINGASYQDKESVVFQPFKDADESQKDNNDIFDRNMNSFELIYDGCLFLIVLQK